jgi:APA family basic amino acid/polyamine antiporter
MILFMDYGQNCSEKHPRYRVPHPAEATVGAILVTVVVLADVRAAIGFSAFSVLRYYAITNVSALILAADERLYPRSLAVAGVAGCLLPAVTLPLASIAAGLRVMLAGFIIDAAVRCIRGR